MRIGIDISALQTGHRMRGIGAVASNILRNLSDKDNNFYIFYVNKTEDATELESIFSLLSLEQGTYAIRYIQDDDTNSELPGKLRYISKFTKMTHGYLRFIRGDSRYAETDDLDVFLQLDQSRPTARLPKAARNIFIAYDLIPYIMEKNYLWSYRTSRKNKFSRKASLKRGLDRWMYLQKLKLNAKRADKILAISDTTKRDFAKYTNTKLDKIDVCFLGVDKINVDTDNSNGTVDRYYETPWMYISKKESLAGKDFLLFVGGADERRRLDSLVGAYNNLRARGVDLKLVLCGDIMKGPKNIPSATVREALESSSYKDDIYYLGFTDDKTKQWLYQHAKAFVFPSLYEGFGLPVLEALSFGTPVVCYEATAVTEVARDFPYYAKDLETIIEQINNILSTSERDKKQLAEKSKQYAEKFTWQKTTKCLLKSLH